MLSSQSVSSKRRGWARVLAALLLCLALGVYSLSSPREAERTHSVAPTVSQNVAFRVVMDGYLAKSEGSGWREVAAGDEATFGRPLRAGPTAQSELSAGTTRLTLGPGATVTPCSATLAKLSAGNLRVSAQENGTGFTVDTAFGKVELHGGELQLHADAERVLLDLLSGHADVLDGSGRKPVAVPVAKIAALSTAGFNASADGWSIPATFTPQDATSQPDIRPAPHGSPGIGRLVLHDSSGREMGPLEVQELNVKTTILSGTGSVALTEIEETFYNPGDRQAEGTFYFTAPPGASLARLAMWVGDTLVEGELVDRARARHVYEEIVRHMQDPALMEWEEGNVFKTRIFPIPARGTKRIIIAYTQSLAAQNGDYAYVYTLGNPTDARLTIGRFKFDATISRTGDVTCRNYADARIEKHGAETVVSLTRDRFQPAGDLALRFRATGGAPISLAADRRSGEPGFFLLSYRAPNANPQAATENAERPPRDMVLMIDTSLSRHADDYHAQLRAARVLLEQLRPMDRFAILSFDVVTRVSDEFTGATPTHINAALAKLDAIMPLGATDIGAAFTRLGEFLKNHPARGNPDAILLGDGIATFGKTALNELLPAARRLITERKLRFSAMALGAIQERLLLSELTRAGGGLFRTTAPGENVETEAFRLGLALESTLLPAPKISFKGVEITEVYLAQPSAMLPGQEILIAGRYASAGKLEGSVEQGTAAPVMASFDLPETESSNVFIPRLWAREKLDALRAQPVDAQMIRQIVALSQEFTIISPYTSFIVLESEKQYEQYGITRQLRRRYWEEQGKLRSAPPSAQPVAPVAPAEPVQPAVQPTQTVQAAPPQPQPKALAAPRKPFFETLDLSALGQRFSDGREVSTALSTLCLEVYYRYRQLNSDSGNRSDSVTMITELQNREVAQAYGNTTYSTITAPQHVPSRGPVQTRDVIARPEDVPAPQKTDPTPIDVNAMSTASDADRELAQTSHEFLYSIAGQGGGDGTGIGVESGEGHGSFGMRNGGGRRLMVMRHGGSIASESASDYAMTWLERQQHSDGHWGAAGYEESSLALLSFLGAGHTQKVGSRKDAVRRGVEWLIAMQDNSGRIGTTVYDQALATLALSEAAGMARIPATVAAAQKSVDCLTRLARDRSGWALTFDAQPSAPAHPLVTAFAITAMKSAKVAGLHVESAAFENAIQYLDEVQAQDGAVGLSGKPAGNEINLLNTAALAMARVFVGGALEDARVRGAAAHLLRLALHRPLSQDRDGMFTRYFGTLLMFQLGGDTWKQWNEWLKAELVESEIKDGPDAGSWNPVGIWIFGRVEPALAAEPLPLIRAALNGIRSHKGEGDAYIALAQALSQCGDIDALHGVRSDALLIDNASAALVSLRIGMLWMERQHVGDAVAEFKIAYDCSDHAENVLPLYIGALRQSGEPRSALELLLREATQGLRSNWREPMIATLLLDPELLIDKPRDFLRKRLSGDSARYAELYALCGQAALAKKHPADAAELLAAAYFGNEVEDVNSRREEYLAAYIDALRAAGRGGDALNLMLNEADAAGRWSRYRHDICAALLIQNIAFDMTPAQLLIAKLSHRPAIRLDLCVAAGALALKNNLPGVAADLLALAYRDSGRLERYGQEWTDALRKAGRLKDARDWLVREARDENKLGAWRMAALAEMLLPGHSTAAQAEGLAEDLFTGNPRAQTAFKLALANAANEQGNAALAAPLYGKVYLNCRRPESLVEAYINALLNSHDFATAAKELEFVIPGGYQDAWAFASLREAYSRSGRSEDDILRAATSEIELIPMDADAHIRLAAHFADRGQSELALEQHRQAIRIRPEDAQMYKDLIEKSAAAGREGFAREILVSMLTHWPNHGAVWGVKDELLDALLEKYPRMTDGNDGLRKLLVEYRKKDLVVVLSWDTDKTDVDLHVTEPTKEECAYTHTRNFDGGFLDHDVTTGFGPETYTLRRAMPGEYKIELEYYAGTVPTTATVKVLRDVGGEYPATQTFIVRLEKAKDRKVVTKVKIP